MLFLALLPALITSCAPVTRLPTIDPALVEQERRLQQNLAIRTWQKDISRLHRVAAPLLRVATPECPGELHGQPGFLTVTDSTFPEAMHRTAREIYRGISTRLVILDVLPESPAAAAGLREGDLLTALNGAALGTGRRAQQRLNSLSMNENAHLELERAGTVLHVSYRPRTACSYEILYLNSQDEINAYADGHAIALTRGMLRFVMDDRDLALVITHEISHNSMGHITKKQGNVLLGSLADLLISAATGVHTGIFSNLASTAFSQEFEAEADYVGLYLMARAGYDLEGVADFWRRMSVEHSGSIDIGSTHPTSPERFLSINATTRELHLKQEQGLPLKPELK